jgi:hypothetical protein
VSFTFDLHSAVVFDSHVPYRPVPCHDNAIVKATSQGHGTVRHGYGMACVNSHRPSRDGMWATCPRSASADYRASSTKVVIRSIPIGLAVTIFSVTTRTFTKNTVLSENGMGAAWYV